MGSLENQLKRLIIDTFELEGMSIDAIDSDAPLFKEGLGLDSIDALELGLALKKKYNIAIDPNASDLARHFASVHCLAEFVAAQQAIMQQQG